MEEENQDNQTELNTVASLFTNKDEYSVRTDANEMERNG